MRQADSQTLCLPLPREGNTAVNGLQSFQKITFLVGFCVILQRKEDEVEMERYLSGILRSLQIQAGLLDPELLAPEKYRSGIFLETDTGAAIDILWIDASGTEQQLLGLVPAEELVRFTSLDFTDYHSVIQQLWQEHPLFEEKSPAPYAEYEDFEKQITHLPDQINSIDTISGFYASAHLWEARAMQDDGSPVFLAAAVCGRRYFWTVSAGAAALFPAGQTAHCPVRMLLAILYSKNEKGNALL